MEGLTYDTKSQAETMARDLKTMGHKARIRSLSGGQWRVYIASKELTPGQREEEAEIAGEIRRHRIEKRVEEFTEPSEEEEIKEETKRATRRLAVKKAMEETPEEIEKATVAQKRELLKEEQARRVRRGIEAGEIVPVYNPETKQIIDYKLEIRGVSQKISEMLEKRARTRLKKTVSNIKELPVVTNEFAGDIIGHTAGQIDVKRGMQTSIPGQAPTPRAVIAALPQRDIGAIGIARPAIGRIGKPGMEEANALGIRTKGFGAQPTTAGFGSTPSEPPLKTTPKAQRITANGLKDASFAKMLRLKKLKPEEEQ